MLSVLLAALLAAPASAVPLRASLFARPRPLPLAAPHEPGAYEPRPAPERLTRVQLERQRERLRQIYERAVAEITSRPKLDDPSAGVIWRRNTWAVAAPWCEELSLDLRDALSQQFLEPRRLHVDAFLMNVRDGRKLTHHQFLAEDRLGTENELIIDPSYLQFFRRVPRRLPTLFLGTRRELVDVFWNHRLVLKPYELGQGRDARQHPATFTSRVYGFADGRVEAP